MKYSNIRVLAAQTVEQVENGQCDEVRNCDTVKEAKLFARYVMDPKSGYLASNEFSKPMACCRVMAEEQGGNDVCLDDRYAK
jgi:hypothetical protein